MAKLKFQLSDSTQSTINNRIVTSYTYHAQGIKDQRWIICKTGKNIKAGIEHSDNPNTLPVIWLIESDNIEVFMPQIKEYLSTMNYLGQTYSDFN